MSNGIAGIEGLDTRKPVSRPAEWPEKALKTYNNGRETSNPG